MGHFVSALLYSFQWIRLHGKGKSQIKQRQFALNCTEVHELYCIS